MNFRVRPLNEEFEDVGVEAQRCQMHHIVTRFVATHYLCSHVNQTLHRLQRA